MFNLISNTCLRSIQETQPHSPRNGKRLTVCLETGVCANTVQRQANKKEIKIIGENYCLRYSRKKREIQFSIIFYLRK